MCDVRTTTEKVKNQFKLIEFNLSTLSYFKTA